MEANIAADPLAYPITLKIAASRHRVPRLGSRLDGVTRSPCAKNELENLTHDQEKELKRLAQSIEKLE
jgi:hypothetical protein